MSDNDIAARNWVSRVATFPDEALARVEQLIALLTEENSRQNLVSQASLQDAWSRHIWDSAQLLSHVPRGTFRTWIDLGSGAGFPGVVIAAICPAIQVTLVESRARRVDWLERVCKALRLTNIHVAGQRLEMIEAQPFDVISARAFAPLDRLLLLAARFSTSSTQWLLPKGRSAEQELAALRGWDHTFHVERSLTDPEAGIVVGKLAGQKG